MVRVIRGGALDDRSWLGPTVQLLNPQCAAMGHMARSLQIGWLRYVAVPALREGHTVLLKMVAHSFAFVVSLGLLLFLPAGTIAWPQAWLFMALFIGCSEAIGIWLAKSDPDLLAARMKSPLGADQTPRDRAVMGAILVVFCGWLVFMALDAQRFGWSHTPWWTQALGAALIHQRLLWVGRNPPEPPRRPGTSEAAPVR